MLLLALIKTVKSECFAVLPKRALKDANANVTNKVSITAEGLNQIGLKIAS